MKALTQALREAKSAADETKLKELQKQMQDLIFSDPNSVPSEFELDGDLGEILGSQLASSERAPRPNIVLVLKEIKIF